MRDILNVLAGGRFPIPEVDNKHIISYRFQRPAIIFMLKM